MGGNLQSLWEKCGNPHVDRDTPTAIGALGNTGTCLAVCQIGAIKLEV
jgi:hypothetical protein